jgi:hypothetical protein
MCSGALSCTTGRANKRAFPILLPLVHAAVLIGQPVKGVRFEKLGIFVMACLHIECGRKLVLASKIA